MFFYMFHFLQSGMAFGAICWIYNAVTSDRTYLTFRRESTAVHTCFLGKTLSTILEIKFDIYEGSGDKKK